MKKNRLKNAVLSALTAAAIGLAMPSETSAAINVAPIENLSPDFIKGADVSITPELEKYGSKFYDDGVQQDPLVILKNHGVNWIRLRIWNDPYYVGSEGVGGGNTDTAKALAMTKRAKDLGMKVLIDFHYSDFWADPGQQKKPDAWKNDDGEKLAQDVYSYTDNVMKQFKAQGTLPDMVQIGNEINNGMMWSEGKLSDDKGYGELAKLIESGLKAVHDNDPDHKVKTMIHLAGVDKNVYQSFFDKLITENKVNDFDVIGMSFYPYWHGTMDDLKANMNNVSARYNKDVLVVETAFAYTLEDADFEKNNFGEVEEKAGGYKATVQGQATGIRDVMATVADVNDKRGLGVFYWAPDWILNKNVGWKSNGGGNGWDNQTLFDTKGNALDSMDVFNLVSDKSNSPKKEQIASIDAVRINGGINSPIALPETVGVVYDNDSVKNMPVKWAQPAPVYTAPGEYTVSGTIEGISKDITANISIANKINLVQNSDFENEKLDGWNVEGTKDAVNITWNQGDTRGKCAMHYWSEGQFSTIIFQRLTGLKDGRYTMSCWAQGSGAASSYKMFANSNGVEKTVDIKDDGWSRWHQVIIKDIEVKNGEAQIGFAINGSSDTWGSIDDVEFYLQE